MGELEQELAKLAERSAELAEDQKLPRGALPGLFRALRAATPAECEAALGPLAARLADLPLLAPTLAWVRERGLAAAFAAALAGPGAWCASRQAAALAEAAPRPEWLVDLLAQLSAEDGGDPSALALELGVEPFCDAMRELLRLRLSSLPRRRDRTSQVLALGALRALAQVAADEGPVQEAVTRILRVETRRSAAAKGGRAGEPVLALAALDALAASPPVARIRLLQPLVSRLGRRKVQQRAQELLDAAVAALGVGPVEVAELTARTGGADPDGWVRVAREEGGEVLLRIDARGGVERGGDPPQCREDERATSAAEERLQAAWLELARRLERSLVSGRTWDLSLWRAVFQEGHPLWSDLAGRLLWEVRSGDGERTRFALGEGGPQDLFGESVALPAAGRVALLHPVLLDADELELWREWALERAVAAPFPQVFRRVASPGEDPFARFLGREAYREQLAGMATRGGWSGAEGAELIREQGDVSIVVQLEQVLTPFRPTDAQRRAAARKRTVDGKKPEIARPREIKPRVRVAAVEVDGDDPVVLAEAVRDLEELTDPLATVTPLFLREWQQKKWKDPQESWRAVVLAYRRGSPATLEVRRALTAALLAKEGLEVRLEDRFAIVGSTVVELGTGLCHEGPPKDHLPLWKLEERLAAADLGDPPPLPFRAEVDPETVAVVGRVVLLAREADDADAAPATPVG